LLLGYKPVQHVTILNTVGNCNNGKYYGLSLTETSLCGAWLIYYCGEVSDVKGDMILLADAVVCVILCCCAGYHVCECAMFIVQNI